MLQVESNNQNPGLVNPRMSQEVEANDGGGNDSDGNNSNSNNGYDNGGDNSDDNGDDDKIEEPGARAEGHITLAKKISRAFIAGALSHFNLRFIQQIVT